MLYVLYNVTGKLINNPCKISDIEARNFDDAFIKSKAMLCNGIREELGLTNGNKIRFTEPCKDTSVGYGDNVRYTTCSIEDMNGFVLDTYDYAIQRVVNT